MTDSRSPIRRVRTPSVAGALHLVVLLPACQHDIEFLNSVSTISSVTVGSSAAAAIVDGRVYTWGSNLSGVLAREVIGSNCGGTLTPLGPCTPTPDLATGLDPPRAIAVGESHACMIGLQDTVSCWGSGGNGQLGDGTYQFRSRRALVGDFRGARQLVVGASHSCVVDQSGALHCWGSNTNGQLGRYDAEVLSCSGSRSDFVCSSPSPAPVPMPDGQRVVAAAAGQVGTCAVLADGRVACWGGNAAGQAGRHSGATCFTASFELCRFGIPQGIYSCKPRPVVIEGVDDAAEVTMGLCFTCARTGDGSIYCWGANDSGQLGHPPASSACDVARSPVPCETNPVLVARGAIALAAGDSHACLVRSDNSVWCWGSSVSGQVGPACDSREFCAEPVRVPGVAARALSCGGDVCCAITTTSNLRCWGSNGFGLLGTRDGGQHGPWRVPL